MDKGEIKCKNCEFYEETDPDTGEGICHRFPPQVSHTHSYGGKQYFKHLQPEVWESDWCGEFMIKGAKKKYYE